jgi:hypothetical protein
MVLLGEVDIVLLFSELSSDFQQYSSSTEAVTIRILRISKDHMFFQRDWFEVLLWWMKAFNRFTPSQKAANAGITNEKIIQSKKNQ